MNTNEPESTMPTENRYVSTAQVAQALGVSVTTVKRWVDDNILPAHRTPGGHRKLLMADVLRLVREGNLPQADLSRLVPKMSAKELNDPQAICDRLIQAYHDGDAEMVRSLLHGAYQHGMPVEVLADRIIGPAMATIGHEWAMGKTAVMQEHRATQATISAMYELKAFLRTPLDRDRPVAVGGAPEHDHYVLPSLLAKMVLLDAGWDAINLGPHTPMQAFKTALLELKPLLVWISITHLPEPEKFLAEYLDFYRMAERMGVAITLGGRGLNETLRVKMPYTTFGDGLCHLASFARTLHRRPQQPRRGRPPADSKNPDRGIS